MAALSQIDILADIPTLGAVSTHGESQPVRRRTLLGGALAAGALGLVGCTPGSEPDLVDAPCVGRAGLEQRRALGGQPLIYVPSGRRQAFWFDAGFAGQLDTWVAELAGDLGAPVTRLDTYGAWTDGGVACDSWHNAGRAFDLATVRLAGNRVVSCRYDRWRTFSGAALERAHTAYWALAAGLHLRFAYVLTYLYDERHANHIHLDNGRSGADLSTFRTRSRVQVQAVQAMLTYLWADPVELTGRWDGSTRAASGRILDQLGLPRDLAEAEAWRGFLRASATRGRS